VPSLFSVTPAGGGFRDYRLWWLRIDFHSTDNASGNEFSRSHSHDPLKWQRLSVVSHAMWRNSSQIIWRKQGHLLTLDRDFKRSDLTNDQVLACGLDCSLANYLA
jgi:hypothetical protein